MRVGERPAADLGVDLHRPLVELVDVRARLAVPELSNVVVLLLATPFDVGSARPAEHRVDCRLGEPLAFDHPLAVVRELAPAEERLEHGRLRLLELEEERIVVSLAEQQQNPDPRPDASDADDLTSRMRVAEPLEEPPAIVEQRPPIQAVDGTDRRDEPIRVAGSDELLDRDDERRVADDSTLAVDEGGQAVQGAQVIFRARLRDVAFGPGHVPGLHLSAPACRDLLDLEACVPDVERAGSSEPPHRKTVRASCREAHPPSLALVEAALATRDREARDEPLYVPLERTGQRLVEVVRTEHQPSVGRREDPEVREVRVTR